MTEDEFSCMGIKCYLGSLSSCAVVGFLCKEGMLLGEGGFVVETSDILKLLCQCGAIGGVCAIGIRTDGVGWCGQSVIGDDGPVVGNPIHTRLDVVYLRNGDVVKVNHVTSYVSWGGFFLKHIATAWNAMGKRKSGDGDGTVFVENLWGFCVDFVEDNLIGGVGAEIVDLWLEDACEVLWPVDVKVLCASEQSEGGEHAD